MAGFKVKVPGAGLDWAMPELGAPDGSLLPDALAPEPVAAAAPRALTLPAPGEASVTPPALTLLAPGEASVTPPAMAASHHWQAGEVVVKFAAGASAAQQAAALAQVGGHALQEIDAGTFRVALGQGVPEDVAARLLGKLPGVDFAEVNWTVTTQATPNETSFSNGSLWGMEGDAVAPANPYGSQADEAWAAGATGSMKVVIGDIDTGIDYAHQDLYLNVWLNQGEIPTAFRSALSDIDGDGLITFRDLNNGANSAWVSDFNGNGVIDAGDLLKDARWSDKTDQDGNGYVDDLVGWNFVANNNNPFDDNGHGTHTAGTIGAVGGNGLGVVGVNWNVEIMALKFLDAAGSGSTANATLAVNYFTAMAKEASSAAQDFVATNNSWGGGGSSSALNTAIGNSAKAGLLFVAAAGNSGVNTDSSANYPSNYSTVSSAGYEAVVSVAALTSSGTLASFSNYGAQTVDIAAPGQGILSTLPGNSYGTYSGTSMATPHVTGALALYASTHPNATAAELREVLLASAAPTAGLAGKDVTGGRLDIGSMMLDSPLTGGSASETLSGGAGNDVISGVALVGTVLGAKTINRLSGGGGNDVFVLGDARGVFYNDGVKTSSGTADYALILDWQTGDHIQLSAKGGTYFTSALTLNGVSGTGVFWDSNANQAFDTRDELIGLVANKTGMLASDFIFA